MLKVSENIKLLVPMGIIIIIFSILTINIIITKSNETQSLQKLKNGVLLSVKISNLVHELQKERGLSVGFASSKGRTFHQKLQAQRARTDKKLKDFIDFKEHYILTKGENNALQIPLDAISNIYTARKSIDSLNFQSHLIIVYYSHINALFLKVITEVTKRSNSKQITPNIFAYSNFLYNKEYAGIERALGTEIILGEVNKKKFYEFTTLLIKQTLFHNLYQQYASNDFLLQYQENPSLVKMRNTILSMNRLTIAQLDASTWFKESSLKINTLKGIEDKLSKLLIESITKNITTANYSFFLTILLNIISIIVFIIMIFLIMFLVKSKQKLKDLIDEHVIFSSTDLSGVITDISQAFVHISGYKREELIGKPHNIVRHPDMPKRIFKQMYQTLQRGEIWKGTVKNLTKKGESYWVDAIISPIHGISGKVIGYNAIRHDISAKKNIELLNKSLEKQISLEVKKRRDKDKQLIQQSRLAQMGEMISMIAHQWRQPLAAISSTSTAINLKSRLGKLDNEIAIELSNKISNYAAHLSSTIDDFRDFFKTNKTIEQTSFPEIMQSILGIAEHSLNVKNIELIQGHDTKEPFHSYTNELKQVILNLIKNAEDALMEQNMDHKYIKIHSYKKGDNFFLDISDNAGGIPEDIIEHIFDPYFSTKMQKDGTGLGLYMSKTIIEDHCKGTLSITNSSDGALCKITLPKNISAI